MRALQMLQRSYMRMMDCVSIFTYISINYIFSLPLPPHASTTFYVSNQGPVSYIAEVKLSDIECNCAQPVRKPLSTREYKFSALIAWSGSLLVRKLIFIQKLE